MKIEQFEIERKFSLDASTLDREKRTIEGASIASDTPVKHMIDGVARSVVLVHEKGSVHTRGEKVPLLWSHDMDQPIGNITNVRVEGGKTRGTFNFSRNSKATEVWQDIQDGFLSDTSVRAVLMDFEEDGDTVRVTQWLLPEGSVVTTGADNSVGLDRSIKEEKVMTDEKSPETVDNKGSGDITVADLTLVRERNQKQGAEAAIKAERKRISDINRMFDAHLSRGAEVSDLLTAVTTNDTSVQRAGELLLELLSKDQTPLSSDFVQTEKTGSMDRQTATVTEDQMDKFLRGAGNALEIRANVASDEVKKTAGENPYLGSTLSELAAEYLRAKNIGMGGMSRMQIVGRALDRASGMISHTTSDFPALLENVANKSMMMGWTETQESWRQWCQVGSVQDFKEFSRINTSLFPDLEEVPEGAEFPYKTMSDLKEKGQLVTYGALFSLTRQSIINDDLRGMTDTPANMGRSAARKVGDIAYLQLTSNPTMNQDGVALFDAAHNNLGTGGPISVTTVDEARILMALQKDPSGATLNLRTSNLLCPVALSGVASTLRNSQYDPAGTAGTSYALVRTACPRSSKPAARFPVSRPV